MSALPSISIVVPNFNGGATIGKTLQSLVDQGYPRLEIIVVDGGSTDNSVEVIRLYEKHIAWWVSEKDRGQSHAINKGFARCTGEIVNWLCSDDTLEPGALHTVGRAFAESPDIDVVVGDCRVVHVLEGNREEIWPIIESYVPLMPCCNPIPQSSCFYRRYLLDRDPVLDESYHYTMDFELWNYFQKRGARWRCIPKVLSTYPMSDTNKTGSGGAKIAAELVRVYRAYTREPVPLTFWYKHFRFPLERRASRSDSPLLRLAARVYFKFYLLLLTPFYGAARIRAMNWRWIRFASDG
jgi:glycosyltransferase involved in cell wall biosynthesis